MLSRQGTATHSGLSFIAIYAVWVRYMSIICSPRHTLRLQTASVWIPAVRAAPMPQAKCDFRKEAVPGDHTGAERHLCPKDIVEWVVDCELVDHDLDNLASRFMMVRAGHLRAALLSFCGSSLFRVHLRGRRI